MMSFRGETLNGQNNYLMFPSYPFKRDRKNFIDSGENFIRSGKLY